MPLDEWAGPDGELASYLAGETQRTLDSYRAQPILIDEHANVEPDSAHGGYQHRQLFELVQNSADALWGDSGAPSAGNSGTGCARGRVEVRLANDCLYCADDGESIQPSGVKAHLFSHLSPKRGTSQMLLQCISEVPLSVDLIRARQHASSHIRALLADANPHDTETREPSGLEGT